MELLNVDGVEDVRKKLMDSTSAWTMGVELLPLEQLCGRVLACDLYAEGDIPGFRRSTVDGYAVKAKDTAAASESLPVFLSLKERIAMGQEADVEVFSGQCVYVPTGAMLPRGADAVVMVEYAEVFDIDGVALYHSVAVGEHIVEENEDVKAGALLFKQGKCLQPKDIGALAANGITHAKVYEPLRMTVFSTGDELVSPDRQPTPGQVRDINTYAIRALAEQVGFAVVNTEILIDNETRMEKAVRKAMQDSDIVVVSGGSSQGEKDATSRVLDRVSTPGVFTHGMAIRPGKPTIVGYDAPSKTVLIGLPGHPVSALMVFEQIITWFYRQMTGTPTVPSIPAQVNCNLASVPGRLNCWPTKLIWDGEKYIADPVFGKSGLITTLTEADGYFTVERGREGVQAGEQVLVHLF